MKLPSEYLPEVEPLQFSLPPIVCGLEFLADDIPDDREIIRGVLTARSKGVLSGCSKAGKTWLLIDAGVSVSQGMPFLGLETTQGRVLFINMELKPRTFQKRLRAVLEAKGIAGNLAGFDVMHLRGRKVSYETLLPALIDTVADTYAFIILDPIYKLYGRLKENAAEDMATLTTAIGELAEQSGAAVLYSTHHTKGNQAGKNAIDRVSGSGVIGRDADALLDFTANETENVYSVEATLREFKPLPPFAVRWTYPLFTPDASVDPSRLKQPGPKKRHDLRELLECIEHTTEKDPVSVSKWAATAGIARASLYEYLAPMRQNGWIATSGDGPKARKYITENGKKALAQSTVGVPDS
jgi:hypothetical protein